MSFQLASTSFEEPLFKKARSSDYVVSLIHPEAVDVIEDSEFLEVFYISQNMRSISDPAVGERSALVANSEAEGSLKIKGTLLDDYMVIHYNHMMLICFEVHKILDQGFSDILKSYGGLKEHQSFVQKFKKFAEQVVVSHKVPIPKGSTWVESVPFGVFAEAICVLYDCKANSEFEVDKLRVLKKDAEGLFKDVMEEGVDNLEEESTGLSDESIDFVAFKMSPVQDLVREWAHSARNRVPQNSWGHPFGPSTPQSMRKAALKFYNKCLEHDITKSFRNVAQLGKLKLEINEQKLKQPISQVKKPLNASDFLISDDE